MELPIFQVDAFASQAFSGNPAAVMPLDTWLPDVQLQAIAMENNLSETAFFVACDKGFELRWFTPAVEVDLCGHATLATAHVLFEHLNYEQSTIHFHTRSGELVVTKQGRNISMDFPATNLQSLAVDPAVSSALGATAFEALTPGDNPAMVLYVFENEAAVAGLTPDFAALLKASASSVICTSVGDQVDFVSRFFGPQVGLDEDPVTGSAHCNLVPYWAQRLNKSVMTARQISSRGGDLLCELQGNRVFMRGSAVTFMKGSVYL